jgi:DNA-binding NtrC family response regulator
LDALSTAKKIVDVTNESKAETDTVILIDADVLVRTSLCAYLRECGLHVIEASDVEEARQVMSAHSQMIDVVLCDAGTVGTEATFTLMHWVRQHQPESKFLAAGTIATAANLAGDICESGPQLSKPYDHNVILNVIRQARSNRARNSAF